MFDNNLWVISLEWFIVIYLFVTKSKFMRKKRSNTLKILWECLRSNEI